MCQTVHADDSSIKSIRAAMDQIERETESVVEFRQKLLNDSDYLHIFPGDG